MKNIATILTIMLFPIFVTGAHADVTRGEIPLERIYIATGFSADSIGTVPADTTGWMVLSGVDLKKKPLRIQELGLEGVPVHRWFSMKKTDSREFTFLAVFNVSDSEILKSRHLGLMVRQIADNWQVYLNGHLVRSEMDTDKDGNIRKSRLLSFVLVHLSPLYLKGGENVIAFRIAGDPTCIDTGFYRVNPLVIDDYDVLLDRKSETVTLVLIFIYLFIGFYHLILFINRRKEKYNLYYGCFSILLFLYIFCRTHTGESLFRDTFFVKLVEFSLLYLLIPFAGMFLSSILRGRITAFLKYYSIFSAAMVAWTFLAAIFVPNPMTYMIDILRIWQFTAIIPLLYCLVVLIGMAFVRDIRDRNRRGRGMISSFAASLAKSVPGNLLIGTIVMLFCSVFDLLDSVYWSYGLVLIRYGFLIFVMGITIILSNRFIYIHNRIEALNTDLKGRIDDLDEANRRLAASERRYKFLIEGTTDCIFTMDQSMVIHSANKTMLSQTAISPDDLSKVTLFDIMHESVGPEGGNRAFVSQKLEQFLLDRAPVTLRFEFRSSFGNEPLLMQVRLEFISGEGQNEILGKAVRVTEDALLTSLVSEQQKYTIGNYLMTADDLSHRITRNLNKFFPVKDITLIRIAVREMIINAIEHGNLNISFDEKSHYTMNDAYITFIVERQKHPDYRDRHVHIEYVITDTSVIYRIKDDGDGFDYNDIIGNRIDSVNDQMLLHGRGITFARSVFDEMHYNDSGNEVTLIKHITR